MTPPGAATGVAYLGQTGTDSWGWAIGGAVEIKLPTLAAGDSLFIQANYADGALNYLGLSGSSTGRATALGSIDLGTSVLNGGGAYYPIADAVWDATTLSYNKESGWAIQGQFRHYWVPNLRSAVLGGYTQVDVPENTVNAYDVNVWQVGLNTIWSPVKGLDLGVEVLYSKVEGEIPLSRSTTNGVTSVVGGSTDVWSGGIRAQRNF
ncbi:MAG: hypothetical protein B7Z45_09780 [Azorhizobium sp. 12-66-6]|nr:MAG: hypothetical protein B7Z45_09780 [Azorhizobium sp. 12-66-6]